MAGGNVAPAETAETAEIGPAAPSPARRQAERDLSALVVAIEFTLISVMVGVVLFPLSKSAAHLFRERRVEAWPYLACGLALTLYMWVTVIDHSLTFIGWPMDLGHNLLYIVVSVVLAVQMQFAAEPVGWFALSTVSAILATLTLLYDLRLIGDRQRLARGAPAELFAAVRAQQQGQLRLSPVFLLVSLISLALLLAVPDVFLHQPWHLLLIAGQLLAVLGALVRAIRSFTRWTEPIVQRAMAELEPRGGGEGNA